MINNLVPRDLFGITISSILAAIGNGLVSIFVPLFLLNQGIFLWQVCAFYGAYAICKLLLNYPGTKLINHYGARFGLVVGYSAMAGFLILLSLYVNSGTLGYLPFMVLAMAVQNLFLWSSQHLHISRVMDPLRKNRDLAMMTNLRNVTLILVPFLGGLIALLFGPTWLLLGAVVFVLAAIFPVWQLDKLGGGYHPAADLHFNLRKAPLQDMAANFAFNIHSSVGVMVWPIYLAVVIPNFGQIGAIASISMAVGIGVLYFIGIRGDKGKTYRILQEGTASSSLVHLTRLFVGSNPLLITGVTALFDISLRYQQNPWTSLYYTHARQKGVGYILNMEIAGDLAAVLLWTTLGITAFLIEGTVFFTVAFVAASIFAWLCLLIRRDQMQSTEKSWV